MTVLLHETWQDTAGVTGRAVEVEADATGAPLPEALRAAARALGDYAMPGPSGLVLLGRVQGRLTTWRTLPDPPARFRVVFRPEDPR